MLGEKHRKQLTDIKTHLLLKDIIPNMNLLSPTTCPICNKTGKWRLKGRGEIGICYSSRCRIRLLNDQGVCDVITAYRLINKTSDEAIISFTKALEELELLITNKLDLEVLPTYLLDERHKVISQVWSTFNKELHSRYGVAGMKYLLGRGFKEDTIQELGLGYASNNTLKRNSNLRWDDLYEHKLIDNTSGREFFWDSIIFPVRDCFSRLLHLQGRSICTSIPKNENGDDMWPRYKATYTLKGIPNIDMFMFLEHKLGLYKSNSNNVFVCEGVPDVISLYQSGGNSIGIFGTHGLLRNAYKFQGVNEITIVADNDKYDINHPYYAGLYKSWERLIPQIISLQLCCPTSNIFIFIPPTEINNIPIKDINDMFKTGLQGDNLIEYILKRRIKFTKFLLSNKFENPDLQMDILKIIKVTGECKEELERLILNKHDNFMNYLLNVITT